jgi:outer membrane protein OmpA-like peptidoglycan-associated protein
MTLSVIKPIVFFIVVGSLLSTAIVQAQQQAVTRVEGFVKDQHTGKPVGCKLYFYNEEGKKVRDTKSSETDGSYLVVLNDAGKHKVVLAGYNVYRTEDEVVVPKSLAFQDIKKDFMVREFEEGQQLASVVGFDLNSTSLTAAGRSTLDKVKGDIEHNQQLRVQIDVYPDMDQVAAVQEEAIRTFIKDSLDYEKELAAWEKKYKKKTTKPDPPTPPTRPTPPADPNAALVEQRIKVIKDQLKDVRNYDMRVEFAAKPLPANLRLEAPSEKDIIEEMTSKKKKKGASATSTKAITKHPGHSTIVISIGKVQRLFD